MGLNELNEKEVHQDYDHRRSDEESHAIVRDWTVEEERAAKWKYVL